MADTNEPQARSFAVEGNDLSGYVGVDPVYMNYASDTEKPLKADGGDEARNEKAFAAAVSTDVPKGVEKPKDRVEPQGTMFQQPVQGEVAEPAPAPAAEPESTPPSPATPSGPAPA